VAINIGTLLFQGAQALRESKIESPQKEARLILASLIDAPPEKLFSIEDQNLAPEIVRDFQHKISMKQKHCPTAYLTGEKEFYSRKFHIERGVLIPRPETEELVEWVIEGNKKKPTILDLCCGSGAIGVTLFLEINPERVLLSDISKTALKVTQANIDLLVEPRYRQNISVLESNLFASLPEDSFDIIVSNPPYVLPDEYPLLEREVLDYEPEAALLVTNHTLFNTKLIDGSWRSLHQCGTLYLETNPLLIPELEQMMEKRGFFDIKVKNDLSGKARFIQGTKPC